MQWLLRSCSLRQKRRTAASLFLWRAKRSSCAIPAVSQVAKTAFPASLVSLIHTAIMSPPGVGRLSRNPLIFASSGTPFVIQPASLRRQSKEPAISASSAWKTYMGGQPPLGKGVISPDLIFLNKGPSPQAATAAPNASIPQSAIAV